MRKGDDPGVHPLDAIPAPQGPVMDAVYAEIKRRAQADPGVLQLLRSVPEIQIKVTRQTVQMTDETLTGRLAGLIAGGFFDDGTTASAAHTELQRLGRGSAKESNGYKAVEGMKVNVVEA